MWLGFGADYREAPASRRRRRSSRRTRWCSSAATRLPASTASRSITDAGYVAAGDHRVVPARDRTVHASSAASDRPLSIAAVRPLPQLTPANEWFWTSGADGRLRIQRCDDCGRLVHPPVPMCPACRSRNARRRRSCRARDRRRVHRQPPPVAARLRAAVRDRDRRPRRGPDGAPHHERRRLRPGRRPHRPRGRRPLRATRRRVASVVRTDRRRPTRRNSWPSRSARRRARRFSDDRFEHRSVLSGVGRSAIGRRLMVDPLSLTVDACLAAVADAGLTLDDIDGLSTYPAWPGWA